jgi:AbrB family looped-hinge helix DNA binding protein
MLILVPEYFMVTTAPLTIDQPSEDIMATVARVSEGGKMNIPADIRRQVGLEHGGPVMVSVVDGEIRMRAMRLALADLQNEAQSLFAGSGETVDGFLRERRQEAEREGDLQA